MPVLPETSVHPEVSDVLLVALRDASIIDEHRALIGAVIEKIQLTESGLNEAYSNLLTGFEVSDIEREKPRVVSSPWDTVRCSATRTGQRINLLL